MNGMAIGKIKESRLTSPRVGTVIVKIDKEYEDFLNTSTVFTIADDDQTPGRKSLLCKNCDQNAPKIFSGHIFTGLNRFNYEFACFGKTASDFWDKYLYGIVTESINTAKALSADVLDELKKFEAEHHEEFVLAIEQLKQDIKELPPQMEKQLHELIGKNR